MTLSPDVQEAMFGLPSAMFVETWLRAIQRDATNAEAARAAFTRRLVGSELVNALKRLDEAGKNIRKHKVSEDFEGAAPSEKMLRNAKVSNVMTPAEERTEHFVLCDPELARVTIGLHLFPLYRVWLYGQQAAGGVGWLHRDRLIEHVIGLGFIGSRRYFNMLQKRPESRLFWRVDTVTNRVYLVGQVKLAERLVKRALAENPALVENDRPGARRVRLDLTGRLKEAQARVYNACLAQRAERREQLGAPGSGYVQTSRVSLKNLFGRKSVHTFRKWEQAEGVKSEPGYAEHHDPQGALVPAHAYLCADETGATYASWRLPNRYRPGSITEHPHKGQSGSVRKAANEAVREAGESKPKEPADKMGGGTLSNAQTGRLYFVTTHGKRATVSAHEAIEKHLRKHGDGATQRHYAYLGERHGVHVSEFTADGVQRRELVDRDFYAEQSPEFQRAAWQFRVAWEYRAS
jgi:hypothetical protein